MHPNDAPANIGILGTGSYLPEQEVTNAEVADRVGVTAEWIERKTQIESRRYAAPDEATSDLATKAARKALEQAGITAEEIDYIILSTSTGDFPQPPTSCLVQHALGATRAACFDLNAVCSGFIYGLALARSLITTSPGAKILLVGADLYSRFLDFSDRRTAVILGDGAGAVVVAAQPAPYGIIGVDLATYGNAHNLIWIDSGGSRNPASAQSVAEGGHYFKMDGRGVRTFVNDYLPPALDRLTSTCGYQLDQIDHFVPHQANGVILNEILEKVPLENATTHRTLRKFGNVGSASVPVTLDDANRAGALSDGDLVALAAFGGGMSVGTCLLRWQETGVSR
jgi:acetoacetyl-CoA synthase